MVNNFDKPVVVIVAVVLSFLEAYNPIGHPHEDVPEA